MKVRLTIGLVLVVVLSLLFASVALAQVSQATINAILKDAQDGSIDGNWTAAQVQAALDFVDNNPVAVQYSQVQGVLQEFLASLQAPGTKSGELAFTGSPVALILAAGVILMGGGLLLRRRFA